MKHPISAIATVLLCTALVSSAQANQCHAHITPIPFGAKHLAKPAGAHLPKGAFVRFEYPLEDGYALFLYSVPDDFPQSHYGDRGFLLMHDDLPVGDYPLHTFSALRKEDSNNFEALSVAQTCPDDKGFYFVALGYRGDMTSSDLFVAVSPISDGYTFTPLPLVAGGVLDLSRSDPLAIRTWSNLFEGSCNACPTRYEISEYTLGDGTSKRIRRYRTHKLYSSDDALFDDRLRIHFSK